MPSRVTVVCLRSLSYTGTTWLNTVLGCHERALALGPADRLWRFVRSEETGDLCRVHDAACDFWPGFLAAFRPGENLFVVLARYSGKSVFVTNNLLAAGAASQLDHPDITVKYIQLVRDGRAVAASYRRKFPDKSFVQAITGFLQPSFHNFVFDEGDPALLCIRHEDALTDQEACVEKIGRYLGIRYETSALKFWNWRHHLVHGNPGFIAHLRFAEGLPVAEFEAHEFYRQQFEASRGGAPYSFRDDRAEFVLTRFDRFIFDCLAGPDNARFGYKRDSFSSDELSRFRKLADFAIKAGQVPEALIPKLTPFVGAA